MKAARFHDRSDIRVEQIPTNSLSDNDVRVAVEVCGICGSDLQEYQIGPHHTPVDPHPRSGATIPITLGHEFSGRITKVGSSVTQLEHGDPVAVNPNIPCRACRYCEDGMYNICPDVLAVGFQTGTGGFSERTVVPACQVHKLPETVPIEDGALVEPLSVGLHAVRRSGAQAGDTVAVFGCGPIGLAVVAAAVCAGANEIFVSEPNATRRRAALELGATVDIDPLADDPVETIRTKTDEGVDVAYEFAGVEATFNAAVKSTRPDGTIAVGSMSNGKISTNLNDIVMSERTVIGTYCYGFPPRSNRTEFDAIIQSLARNEIDTNVFVTGRIGLENIVSAGFEELLETETDHVKILVEP